MNTVKGEGRATAPLFMPDSSFESPLLREYVTRLLQGDARIVTDPAPVGRVSSRQVT